MLDSPSTCGSDQDEARFCRTKAFPSTEPTPSTNCWTCLRICWPSMLSTATLDSRPSSALISDRNAFLPPSPTISSKDARWDSRGLADENGKVRVGLLKRKVVGLNKIAILARVGGRAMRKVGDGEGDEIHCSLSASPRRLTASLD